MKIISSAATVLLAAAVGAAADGRTESVSRDGTGANRSVTVVLDPLVITATGDGASIVSVCIGGAYRLLVGTDAVREIDIKRAAVLEDTVEIGETLMWSDRMHGTRNRRLLYRLSGYEDLYAFPNPVIHTRTLAVLRAGERLHHIVWLPGDNPSGPGRNVRLSHVDAALMWLSAVRCRR